MKKSEGCLANSCLRKHFSIQGLNFQFMSSFPKFYQVLSCPLIPHQPPGSIAGNITHHDSTDVGSSGGLTGSPGLLRVGLQFPDDKHPGMARLALVYGHGPCHQHSADTGHTAFSKALSSSALQVLFQHHKSILLCITQENVRTHDIYGLCCIWLNMIDMGICLDTHEYLFQLDGGCLLSSCKMVSHGEVPQKCFQVG